MGLFRPLEQRVVRWRAGAGDGLEHLSIGPEDGAIVARGVAIGRFDGAAFGVRYTVTCDADWTFRSLAIDSTDGKALRLTSDGHGTWAGAHGQALAGFDACIDIDLGGSAFTNTLPIRRLAPEVDDGPVELAMAYVPFDTFAPFVDIQRYTCLETGRRFRYEAADGAFASELSVDGDGLLLDFPPLFARLTETEQ